MSTLPRLLIVDDEKNTREALARLLSSEYQTTIARNADEAIRYLGEQQFEIVLTDLRLGGNKSGLTVLQVAKGIPSVMMTAFGDVETAVSSMKFGAFDFITKPLDLKKLKIILQQAYKKHREDRELNIIDTNQEQQQHDASITNKPKSSENTAGDENLKNNIILAPNSPFEKVLNDARKIATSNANVLIIGETGTGKEILAKTIHEYSKRKEFPLVPVHCAALSSSILESELFGHEKGSFTGATAQHIGRFESANNGTLFLDEIGEIDANIQVKLLRFLETKTLERVGSNISIPINTRVVSATNKNLRELVKENKFREDLYYRLNVIELQLPPLRDRLCDIPLLINHYIAYFAHEMYVCVPQISDFAMDKFVKYQWPGNVRELKNTCESILALLPENKKIIEISDLGEKFS